ncbi:unnamed protein product [Prunus armeniaca]|uniref:Uncharacterized protein n=1 Tax=Prunus armeniaca TaxID=36596 RepID=A0A6J5TYL5_PRUAR|nr:unnamed protein product [Prunus armeniaca]
MKLLQNYRVALSNKGSRVQANATIDTERLNYFLSLRKRNGAYFACFWSRSNCSRCPAWTDALHTASMANDVGLVKIILDAGVDVNIRNVQNTIPLHVALAKGAKSCVGLLLSSGANYNLQNCNMRKIQFYMCTCGGNLVRTQLGLHINC